MKTKPFDPEKALAGHPVVTRDGHVLEFPIIRVSWPAKFPILAYINGAVESATETGSISLNAETPSDLFLLVKPHCELPEGVETPKGYRLLEEGEQVPIGGLFFYEKGWVMSCIAGETPTEDCYIVPDYSTGLWKEME